MVRGGQEVGGEGLLLGSVAVVLKDMVKGWSGDGKGIVMGW